MFKNKIVMLFILLLFLLPSVSFAGIPGKVQGKVTDSAGNPLPGANVIVLGTQRGAAAATDGSFAILSLAPGNYSISASMMGYNKFTRTNIQVNADRTTTVDFVLKEADS